MTGIISNLISNVCLKKINLVEKFVGILISNATSGAFGIVRKEVEVKRVSRLYDDMGMDDKPFSCTEELSFFFPFPFANHHWESIDEMIFIPPLLSDVGGSMSTTKASL